MLDRVYDGGKKSISLFIKVLNVLNGALKQAVKNKMIKRNPCEDIVYPANNTKEIRCYTLQEQKAFENALERERNKVLFMTYLYTGTRLGELPALTWKDIHFEENYIDINKKVVVIHQFYAEKKTQQQIQDFCKTKMSKRKIYITNKLITLLEEHKQQQIKEYEQLGLEWTEETIVFPNEKNNMFYVRNIQAMFRRIRNKAGISYGTVHTLRHSYASRCFEANINIKVISQQLGHKNTKITYDTYVHIMPAKQLEEVNKLNKLDSLFE